MYIRLPFWLGIAVLALSWVISPTIVAEARSAAGQLLVANPDMPDPRFAETVIYMCRHDDDGAFGLVLNRRVGDMDLSRVLESFKVDKVANATGSIEVRRGGPVEGTRGYLLHSDEFDSRGSVCRESGVAVSASLDVLEALAAGQGPRRAILFLGYAGWGPGQLDDEIAHQGWSVMPADVGSLFDRDIGDMWRQAMSRRGVDL